MLNINVNINYAVAVLSLMFLMICLYLVSHLRSERDAIACDARLSIVDNDRIIAFRMAISFDNGDGFITLVGKDSASAAVQRLRKTFNYELKKNNVMVMSNDASVMNYSSAESFNAFKKYLPAFFLTTRSDMKMLTRVVRSSDDLLVFMIVDTPLFVCEVR